VREAVEVVEHEHHGCRGRGAVGGKEARHARA
jgi:hypothetical protein